MYFHHDSLTITALAEPLITAAEMATQLRIIDDDLQADLMDEYIAGATEYIRERTGHCFNATSYLYCLDRFPILGQRLYGPANVAIELPRNPLIMVDEIKYVNTDGVITLLDPSQYRVDVNSRPARIVPPRFGFWPVTDVVTPNAVLIKFTAGYSAFEFVPLRARQCIRFLVSHWHQNRLPIGDAQNEIPKGLESLINNLKIGYGLS